MSEPSPQSAVFLSYARDDAAAARRIAEALRASGLEVWFDENELRGGDAWDQKIRQQINDCALFVAVISRHTEARTKGYFRLEWKLAVEQTHMLLDGVPFVAPVAIDDTRETGARVPPEFLRVQWTRLPGALPTPQFVEQIKRLLAAGPAAGVTAPPMALRPVPAPAAAATPSPAAKANFPTALVAALAVVVLALAGYIALRPAAKETPPPVAAKPAVEAKSAAPASSSVLPVPSRAPEASAKSIAVLPFANLSTEKENEFFADGVQDDVITNLAKIRDLTVISRTSTLAYRDAASRNLKKIGAELNVANVLEASVRRVGSKVHMNAQLIEARTDAHLWADTFDGDAGDIFALQASLAQKIAAALKATLTPGERTLIERRPTQNQEAYEFYSRANLMEQALATSATRESYGPIIALHEQAVAKDPAFALAFARLSAVHGKMFWFGHADPTPARRALAQTALESARRLAPEAPETHAALGLFAYLCDNDWRAALAEYALAEPSLPNDASLQYQIGIAHRRLGQWAEALRRFERSAELNPRDLLGVSTHAETLLALRRYPEARTWAAHYVEIFPLDRTLRSFVMRAQFALDGDRAACARGLAALAVGDQDPLGFQNAYLAGLVAGDLAAAERALVERPQATMRGLGGAIVEPVALRRAALAFFRGQKETAAQFADEAIAFYRGRTWTRRQQPLALLNIAEAEAFAGRAEAALRDGRNAVEQYRTFDAYIASGCELALGGIHLALGERDAALEALRRGMSSANDLSPQMIRADPLWSRLKDDPRFEEILKAVKPL